MAKDIGPREAGLRAMREAKMERSRLASKASQIDALKARTAEAATKRGKPRKKK